MIFLSPRPTSLANGDIAFVLSVRQPLGGLYCVRFSKGIKQWILKPVQIYSWHAVVLVVSLSENPFIWPDLRSNLVCASPLRTNAIHSESYADSLWYIVVIPRETRVYRFQLFCPASCPGYISETTQWKGFKLHIRIEHQRKVCNVVFSFDLM